MPSQSNKNEFKVTSKVSSATEMLLLAFAFFVNFKIIQFPNQQLQKKEHFYAK